MLQINVCLMNEDDWQEWKKFAGKRADESYKDYLLSNEIGNKELERQGYKIKIIPFNKIDFEKFCREKGLNISTPREMIKARSAWAGFQK